MRVEYKHAPSEDAPFGYHLTIITSGGETAEEVQIEAPGKDGNTIEKAELTIPFSPKESKREDWEILRLIPAKPTAFRPEW